MNPLRLVSGVVIAILMGSGMAHADATPSGAPAPLLVAERAVVQEGLAIALANNVLNNQLYIVINADATVQGADNPKCSRITGGGSYGFVTAKQTSKTEIRTAQKFYYDAACRHLAFSATGTLTGDLVNLSVIQGAETLTYYSGAGTLLGTMAIADKDSNLVDKKGNLTEMILIGTGRFVPKDGGKPVDLGLTCSLPYGTTTKASTCQGGVAQDFPALHLAIGSVTPLTLTPGAKNSIKFEGKASTVVTGAPGALSVTTPTGTSLGIGGKSTGFTSVVTDGAAAGLELFPPAPTGWTITDSKHGVKFAIAVVSTAKRNLTGTVKRLSTGQTLATLAVDQSGTGSIVYSDHSKAAVRNWTLAD